ncbi:hypothetical protein VTK73DRAFT_4901 [Phialemonium thermophilum]|uniref:Serine/threonine-protein phosphatase 4 regulatory subunit 3-like central domain-containing protein n=1 Tax=Phialemonium thermophilum TaxID=223376 RepID=A0ABR3WRD9_9PEZI
MAQPVPHHLTDKKRVKVYELRNNDWFDRGTGFCTAAYVPITIDGTQTKEPRVVVESEDEPERLLLETKICKEDGFQKQQDTLIVWTEPSNGVDMALSFQEPEGCALIWKFISSVQHSFQGGNGGSEDNLSDDIVTEAQTHIQLPTPELGNLADLENTIRMLCSNSNARDALTKAVINDDYISKLTPLVDLAEDLESLPDLHHLCNIMKSILMLNDTNIIEQSVSDECVMGVVGALEYDPDFPSHKANHRQWLKQQGRYKEVVRIEDETVRRKIHQTYRLQYVKDVVLARILDDPTYSVLNSLIFFNQVDIVGHLQQNAGFLKDLFGIFADPREDQLRKKEAVLFIQQCCAIAKNLQPPARQNLYNNFLSYGLLPVINFGLRNLDVSVRVGATDILVSMIEHDPQLVRHTIYRQLHEKQQPLTDTLIDLLLVEVDLGIRSQVSDALKVLLDPNPIGQPADSYGNAQPGVRPQTAADTQQELFLAHFYEHSAVRLFRPLLDLEKRTEMKFGVLEDGVFSYLNDILCFYVRQHHHRSKFFILQHNIAQRFAQLLACREKHLQLVAIRFFHQLLVLQDEFYIKHIAEKQILGGILDVLLRTVRRDNLLSSACLDLFELIKKENIKDLIKHLVENYREKLEALDSIETFQDILVKYEQAVQGLTATATENYFIESEDELGRRPALANARGLMEHLAVDPAQEEYWNTSDDEEEMLNGPDRVVSASNGESQATKPLVDYESDEESEQSGDGGTGDAKTPKVEDSKEQDSTADTAPTAVQPPERISEKRRREQDEEDELARLVMHKRRNSSSAAANPTAPVGAALRRKKSLTGGGVRDRSPTAPKRISISISPALKNSATKSPPGDEGAS